MSVNKEPILPSYSWIPLVSALALNFAVYIGGNLLALNRYHYDIASPLDKIIPVIPFFVVFYVLAYAQWTIGYVIICRESREKCFRIMTAEMIAKLICFVFFVAFPTTASRPENAVTGNDVFSCLTRLIYDIDTPNNLLPSIHCLESWACFRGALGLKKVPRWYAPVMLAFSLGVFMSTVFLKQHVIIDIPAGILVFEVGILAVKFTKADEKLSRLLPPHVNGKNN